jgi:putative iron-dependent peroxidase
VPTPNLVPQPGIFAQGTRSHHLLELAVGPSATDGEIRAALAAVRQPTVTAGGINLVLGLGASLWHRLRRDDTPADLAPFPALDGLDGHTAPSTQGDVWVWVHGTGEDVVFDAARATVAALAPVAAVVLEQPGFVYHDSRDLTGFVDGSANPPLADAFEVACIPDGLPGAGGSHVLAQRWVHDLDGFHALPVAEQERVIGRTKPDSVELDDAHKPADAHIARVEIDLDGEEAEIYRRSVPYGRVGEMGLYFLAFSVEQRRFRVMLERMFGLADGMRDRLTDFSRPNSGAYYFAPSMGALDDLLGGAL